MLDQYRQDHCIMVGLKCWQRALGRCGTRPDSDSASAWEIAFVPHRADRIKPRATTMVGISPRSYFSMALNTASRRVRIENSLSGKLRTFRTYETVLSACSTSKRLRHRLMQSGYSPL